MVTQFPNGQRRILPDFSSSMRAAKNIKKITAMHKLRTMPQVKISPRSLNRAIRQVLKRRKERVGFDSIFIDGGSGFAVPEGLPVDGIFEYILGEAYDGDTESGKNFLKMVALMPDTVKVWRYKKQAIETVELAPFRDSILGLFRELNIKQLIK